MTAQRYYFADFVLDPIERQLFFKKQQLELNARYLDALLLLVLDAGKLVSKERFFNEVWQGMVVSDEALTQCIRTLRRLLQDSAAAPVFIETVPKHGYRFIAQVTCLPADTVESGSEQQAFKVVTASVPVRFQALWVLTGHGVVGAAIAGLIGGFLYGLSGAVQVVTTGNQALSILLVMLSVTSLIAVLGGAAVSFGLAAACLWQPRRLSYLLLGGGSSGLLIGAFVSLLLQEAFLLFFGRSPAQITGAAEGLILGLAAGFSCWLLVAGAGSGGKKRFYYAVVPGMLAGLLLSLSGGVLLAGSLAQLVAQFPQSAAGSLLALEGFRPVEGLNLLSVLSSMLEAGLFTAGLTLGLQRALPRVLQAT